MSLKEKISCDICQKEFKRRSYLYQHTKKVHAGIRPSSRLLQCEQCDKKYVYRHSLNRHIKKYHMTVDQLVHRCKICDEGFETWMELKLHKRIHKDPEEIREEHKCRYCPLSFKCLSSLKKHLGTHVERKWEQDYLHGRKFFGFRTRHPEFGQRKFTHSKRKNHCERGTFIQHQHTQPMTGLGMHAA